MSFGLLIKLLSSFLFLFIGLMARFSNNEGWSSVKKYWFYLVFGGVGMLLYNIYKYLL